MLGQLKILEKLRILYIKYIQQKERREMYDKSMMDGNEKLTRKYIDVLQRAGY